MMILSLFYILLMIISMNYAFMDGEVCGDSVYDSDVCDGGARSRAGPWISVHRPEIWGLEVSHTCAIARVSLE